MLEKLFTFPALQGEGSGRLARLYIIQNAALDDAEQIFSSFMVKWHGTRHTGCGSTWFANYPYKLRLRAVFHTPDIATFRHPGDFTSYFNLPECPALLAARLLLLSPAFVGCLVACFFVASFCYQLLLSWPACPADFYPMRLHYLPFLFWVLFCSARLGSVVPRLLLRVFSVVFYRKNTT